MALDPEFVADCPYGPGGMLLDDIVTVDVPNSRVVARMPTHDELPLTKEQRVHPIHHPRHVSGGLMVHMTGIMGFVHSYYILGVRHREGWIGYGARLHKVRFHALAKPGEPMLLECTATMVRASEKNILGRYDLRFTQGDTLVYEGDQTAMWIRTKDAAAAE